MSLFVSSRDRNSALRWLVGLAAALALGYLAVRRYAPFLTDPVALRAWIEGFGVWAPLVFVGVQALQVVVAPIPGHVTVVLGGYLFGALPGFLYSMVGVTVGSTVAFWLSRRFGRRYVERVVSPAVLERFDGFTRENALLGVFVGFLVPGIPDDVLCFLAGLTEVPLWKLVVVAVIGRLPSFLVVSVVGAELAGDGLVTALALSGVVVAVAVVAYRYRDAIAQRLVQGSTPPEH
jgi:uncharacterized membrane protein YdjX (TVP38/TMEM64 family)